MSLRVRQLDLREWLLTQTAAECHRRGVQATLGYPSRQGLWVSLSNSERLWTAWLRLSDWLEYASPALAGIASSSNAEHLVIPWLVAAERPFELPVPHLSCERICVGEAVKGDAIPEGRLLHLMSNRGGLWFERLPEFVSEGGGIPQVIRWPLRFTIGNSELKRASLGKVSRGDVLLIRTSCAEVYCFGKKLGHFSHIEEGIIMESLEIQNAQNEVYEVYEDLENLHTLRQLPVRLEFVLHRKQATLHELEMIGQGKLLPLPAEVERNIDIMANGVLLGRGELVQVNEMLGVEIHEWLSESGNGE